jgi:hypothetical protein
MDRFLEIATSFPTLPLSVLLLIAIAYWLLCMLGALELDVVDIPELGDGDAGAGAGLLTGLFLRLRLEGLPFALIYTAVVLIAWVFTYLFSALALERIESDTLRFALGVCTIPTALLVSLPFAGWILQPFRGLFARSEGRKAESLLGEIVHVRSPQVNEHVGTAAYDDGGAGLIIQVRCVGAVIGRGERALVVEYLQAQNAYRVVPPE